MVLWSMSISKIEPKAAIPQTGIDFGGCHLNCAGWMEGSGTGIFQMSRQQVNKSVQIYFRL